MNKVTTICTVRVRISNMFPKALCGFVVLLVVVPVGSVHCQGCKFLKCLARKKRK